MILAVAVRRAGVVYTLPQPARHHDIIAFMVYECGLPTPVVGEQGFLDTERGFLDRRTAAVRAIECGQTESLRRPPDLYPEDLW